jgi:hypothetical protein
MPRPLLRLAWPLSLAALLGAMSGAMSGCASQHTPRAGQPTATLVIDSNQPGEVLAFRNEACEPAQAGARIGLLHATEGEPLRGTAKIIEAGQPLVVTMDMRNKLDGAPVSCRQTGRFTPTQGAVYHLFFRYNAAGRSCTLSLMHRSTLGSIEPEPSYTVLPAWCPRGPLP